MQLKEISISDYKIDEDDVFISEFMNTLKELTLQQGTNQESDTKYERNIMLNLLFQYGYSIAQKKIQQETSFIIGGDMMKYLHVCNNIDQDIINSYTKIKGKKSLEFNDGWAKLSLSPDIVIHTSNEETYNEPKYQHLILEAKTTKLLRPTAFFWDFFKLNVYKEKLNFRHIIYYICGTKKGKLEKYLDKYHKQGLFENHAQDILFVIQPTLKDNVSLYKIEWNRRSH